MQQQTNETGLISSDNIYSELAISRVDAIINYLAPGCGYCCDQLLFIYIQYRPPTAVCFNTKNKLPQLRNL